MARYPSPDIERAVVGPAGLAPDSSADLADRASDSAHPSGAQPCTQAPHPRAIISEVAPGSPADDAGFYPGCALLSANGQPIRDIIDWRWLADGEEIELAYEDAEGDRGTITLSRAPGEDWGFSFEGAIFDQVHLCRNACTFCFMRQLPAGMRPSLSLRDDDFRLSFLQGTFVTLTNLSSTDEQRIVEQHISPLRFSLHAVSPQVRRSLIGKYADAGLAAAERLLAQGIQMHAQIVLVPGENDGEELSRTLSWAYDHPGILGVGVVPLGYTRHQSRFTESFNDPARAQEVIVCIEGFAARARQERGIPWVFAADEFYCNAYPKNLLEQLPPAEWYGDFEMFEDGIGLVRSFVDEWQAASEAARRMREVLEAQDVQVLHLMGTAMRRVMEPLIAQTRPKTGLDAQPDTQPEAHYQVLYVENYYFGGNVSVTGLLTGEDMLRAIKAELQHAPDPTPRPDLILIPQVALNADGLLLDGRDLRSLQSEVDIPLAVVSCSPTQFFDQITEEALRLRAVS